MGWTKVDIDGNTQKHTSFAVVDAVIGDHKGGMRIGIASIFQTEARALMRDLWLLGTKGSGKLK